MVLSSACACGTRSLRHQATSLSRIGCHTSPALSNRSTLGGQRACQHRVVTASTALESASLEATITSSISSSLHSLARARGRRVVYYTLIVTNNGRRHAWPAPTWILILRAPLLLAGLSMLAGLDAALVLLGASAPVTSDRLPDVHGMVMALGIVGTLV
ncbi:MAG TPA: hypothetical protein VFQ11_02705 [Nocardioidaceae bacterium]|nr:hypothetical protein [Nocardioidaceae bacterium]